MNCFEAFTIVAFNFIEIFYSEFAKIWLVLSFHLRMLFVNVEVQNKYEILLIKHEYL